MIMVTIIVVTIIVDHSGYIIVVTTCMRLGVPIVLYQSRPGRPRRRPRRRLGVNDCTTNPL